MPHVRFPTPIFFTLLLLLVVGPGESRADGGFAKFISGEVRRTDARLAEIEIELASLPELNRISQGARYGFRSEAIESQDEPHWVQIDLGNSEEIDGFVAMPVYLPSVTEEPRNGYGFPSRFKIEVAGNAEMDGATVVIDRTRADVENPGRYPLVLRSKPVTGRYVRFTSTRHVADEDGYFWALEELMVLAGNRNLAVGRPGTASTSLELFPNWARHRVNDGLSRLGTPVGQAPSPSAGFLSSPTAIPRRKKWLVVDLLEELTIQEVRLVPAGRDTPQVVGGRGYPRHSEVQLANDQGFGELEFRNTKGRVPLGFPFGSVATHQCGGTAARYVRILTKELFAHGDGHSFALAEVQVYADGENVARGKPVRVSDQFAGESKSGWAPELAVDGFSSTHKLVEWPAFLTKIVRRGELEQESALLRDRRGQRIRSINATVAVTGGLLGGLGLFGWVWTLVGQKALRRRDAVRLREQISRDLHDDIGSNLGGIVLLSELGASQEGVTAEVIDEFREIKETAERTSESMADIVWLIGIDGGDLRELVVRMRGTAARLLGDPPVFVVEPQGFRNRELSLQFRRHVLLAFKETLNNVRKHADASEIGIRVQVGGGAFSFEVTDDGCGFDPTGDDPRGHGLRNIRQRASRLKGDVSIDSVPRKGTRVEFVAPLDSKR